MIRPLCQNHRRRDGPRGLITPRTTSTNGALCLRRRRLGSRYAARWYEVRRGNNLNCFRKHCRRIAGAQNNGRPARGHRDTAGNCGSLAGFWRAGLGRQFVMKPGVLRDTRGGSAVARMVLTRRVHCPDREVERTNAGDNSYKTAHVGLIISVRLLLM